MPLTIGAFVQKSPTFTSNESDIALNGAGDLYVSHDLAGSGSYSIERFDQAIVKGPVPITIGTGAPIQVGLAPVTAFTVSDDGATLYVGERGINTFARVLAFGPVIGSGIAIEPERDVRSAQPWPSNDPVAAADNRMGAPGVVYWSARPQSTSMPSPPSVPPSGRGFGLSPMVRAPQPTASRTTT